LSWARRKDAVQSHMTTFYFVDEWSAFWSSSGSISITVTLSGTPATSGEGIAFAVSGAYTTSPFDIDEPVTAVSGSTASANPSCKFSTSNPYDFVFGCLIDNYSGTPTGNTIIENGVGYIDGYVEESSIQSGASFSFITGSGFWAMVVDAIQAPPVAAAHLLASLGAGR